MPLSLFTIIVPSLLLYTTVAKLSTNDNLNMSSISTRYIANVDHFVHLYCDSRYEISPTSVTFYVNNTEIRDGDHTYQVRSKGSYSVMLVISDPKLWNTGQYHCTSKNNDTSNTLEITIKLAPRDVSVTVKLCERSPGVLECPRVDSVSYERWKDPSRHNIRNNSRVTVTGNIVHIHQVRKLDEGRFTNVQFSTQHGKIQCTINVTVMAQEFCIPKSPFFFTIPASPLQDMEICDHLEWPRIIHQLFSIQSYELACLKNDGKWQNYTLSHTASSFDDLPPDSDGYGCCLIAVNEHGQSPCNTFVHVSCLSKKQRLSPSTRSPTTAQIGVMTSSVKVSSRSVASFNSKTTDISQTSLDTKPTNTAASSSLDQKTPYSTSSSSKGFLATSLQIISTESTSENVKGNSSQATDVGFSGDESSHLVVIAVVLKGVIALAIVIGYVLRHCRSRFRRQKPVLSSPHEERDLHIQTAEDTQASTEEIVNESWESEVHQQTEPKDDPKYQGQIESLNYRVTALEKAKKVDERVAMEALDATLDS